MKKKSIQRIAAWLLAAGMMAGTFAQPMAVYAESTASIAASDSTTGDSITADADVVIATPTPEPDTGTDTAATPVPTADSQTPQDPASTAAPETTPADLQSCIALLAASQLSLDADSIEPDVREETLALSDEITETEPSTLQAVVNAAVFAAPADQTDINVDVPAGNYTGTLVIPDATIVVKDASGKETNINYTNKNITLNMTDSTLTVPTDASVGVSVFGSLTIQGGTIKAADGCTATRGVQVQLGSALTLDGTTISDFTYAGPGAGVYVKGTAAVDTNGQFDVALGKNQEPLQNADNTYQFKKLQRENGNSMDTSFTMKGATITNCKSDGNGAALYVHNAALLKLESANFTTNNAGGFGGAVYLGTGVQTTIGKGVTFTDNHAAKDGGALYLANQYTLHVKTDNILVQVPVTFNGGTFTGNSTDTYGGALAFDPAFDGIADNTIENVTFGQVGTTTSDDENAEEETTLHGNYAALRGGAIAFNSNIKENTLKKCTFRGNTALRYAGAVYYPNNYSKTTEFNPVYTVEGCTFDQNSATYDVKNGDDAAGGAITIQVNPTDTPNTVQVASLHVKNSTFTGNTATGYGGAISTRRETGYGNTITVDGGEYHDNATTSQNGGVIFANGQGNTVTINSGEFYNNKAVNGGAVYMGQLGTLTINGGSFHDNTATTNGGAIVACNATGGNHITTLTITGGEIYNNTAVNGGAVYMSTGTGLGTFTMTGGEIYENTADNGGALYIATKAKVTLSAAEGADVGGIIRDNVASQLASNLYLGGADSSLTVGKKTLLHGGTIAGDVLFAQGGTVDLANTQDLHTDGIENAKDLVWLKNDATTGKTVRSETAPAQTIYTLAPAGENTGSYAARIGSDKYFSINQAIKAMEAAGAEDAETNTTTIHLLRDQTEDVTINNTKHSPTLNLNGYTLTGHITVNDLNNVGLTFTLTDDNTQADYNKAGNGGTLTAASGTLVNIKDQSNKPENTTVKLQGVTLTGSTRGVYAGSNVNLVAEGSSFSGRSVLFSSWGCTCLPMTLWPTSSTICGRTAR